VAKTKSNVYLDNKLSLQTPVTIVQPKQPVLKKK
jgi:hypothetical protein